MHDELKDQLDAAKYRRELKGRAEQPEPDEQQGEDESYVTPEMIEAWRTKGDNER